MDAVSGQYVRVCACACVCVCTCSCVLISGTLLALPWGITFHPGTEVVLGSVRSRNSLFQSLCFCLFPRRLSQGSLETLDITNTEEEEEEVERSWTCSGLSEGIACDRVLQYLALQNPGFRDRLWTPERLVFWHLSVLYQISKQANQFNIHLNTTLFFIMYHMCITNPHSIV